MVQISIPQVSPGKDLLIKQPAKEKQRKKLGIWPHVCVQKKEERAELGNGTHHRQLDSMRHDFHSIETVNWTQHELCQNGYRWIYLYPKGYIFSAMKQLVIWIGEGGPFFLLTHLPTEGLMSSTLIFLPLWRPLLVKVQKGHWGAIPRRLNVMALKCWCLKGAIFHHI